MALSCFYVKSAYKSIIWEILKGYKLYPKVTIKTLE